MEMQCLSGPEMEETVNNCSKGCVKCGLGHGGGIGFGIRLAPFLWVV